MTPIMTRTSETNNFQRAGEHHERHYQIEEEWEKETT